MVIVFFLELLLFLTWIVILNYPKLAYIHFYFILFFFWEGESLQGPQIN